MARVVSACCTPCWIACRLPPNEPPLAASLRIWFCACLPDRSMVSVVRLMTFSVYGFR
jgi:hypothetical protein